MKLFKRKEKTIDYDKTKKRPIIRQSICTGEKVAGFEDIETGKFTDVMLIASDDDLECFLRRYGIPRGELEKNGTIY